MKKIMWWLALCSLPSTLYSGGIVSSGGEFITTESNPWFIGETKISYCIAHDPTQFSLDLLSARIEIEEAFMDWKSTLLRFNRSPTPSSLLDGTQRTLQFQTTYSSTCYGDEDLTFYLGQMPQKVNNFLKNSARFTIAFAKQEEFDNRTGRAKGYIWLTPDKGPNSYQGLSTEGERSWQNRAKFFNVVLHELGHVFGIQHQQFGIMRSDFPHHEMDSKRTVKVTSDYYRGAVWTTGFSNFMCGSAISDSPSTYNFLGWELDGLDTQVCLSKGHGDDYFLSFQKNHQTLKTISINFISEVANNNSRFFEISGNYISQRSSMDTLGYFNHRFIFALTFDIAGYFLVDGQPVTVNIETIPGLGARLSFINAAKADSGWVEIRFPRAFR